MVHEAADHGAQSVMVTLRPPFDGPGHALALQPVGYQRTLAHVKHLGGFGQGHHARMARRAGFDDALFTAPDGQISETSIANIGFVRGDEVVWPSAPALQGITMQLIAPRLAGEGIPTRRAPVGLADLPSYRAAFVTNARGIAPVARIDAAQIAVDEGLMETLQRIYAGVPWDEF